MEAHAAQKVCRHHNARKLTESWANGVCSHGSASSRSTHFSTSTTGRTAGPPTGKLILPYPESCAAGARRKSCLDRQIAIGMKRPALPCARQICCLLLQGLFSAGRHRLRMARAAKSSCSQSLAADLGPRTSSYCLLAVWQNRGLGRITPIVTMMSGASAE